MIEKVKTIAVLGAGIMGNGIAQVSATAGFKVHLRDINDEAVNKGLDTIQKSLGRIVKKGQITEEQKQEIFQRISPYTNLEESVKGADMVIEAITENLELKKDVFRIIDKVCPPEVVFCSNTSQLSITAMSAVTSRPDKFVGTHFFSPPVMMPLVELIKGIDTSDETLELAKEYTTKIGKEYVICKKDVQGFACSRMINIFLLEAMRVLEEDLMTPEDIDKACRLGFNHPMGPLQLADFAGLDTFVNVNNGLRSALGDRFLLTENVRKLVEAGYTGSKAGRGFFKYNK